MNAFVTIAEKLYQDQAVWERVKTEVAKAPDPQTRFLELAREYGHALDAAELARSVKEVSELAEDELEGVSGGFSGPGNIAAPPQQLLIGLLLPAVQKVRG